MYFSLEWYGERQGGGAVAVEFDGIAGCISIPHGGNSSEVVALDDALNALARLDPRKVQVIEMRFFGGLSVEECAAIPGVSEQTVMRDWRLAKSWLSREMAAGTGD